MKAMRGARGRRVRAVLAVGAAGLLLAACGSGGSEDTGVEDAGGDAPEMLSESEWDDVVAKAKEEGQVTVFASPNYADVHFKEFEKVYPEITVTVERQSTGDLLPRLEQELSVPKPAADVAWHSSPNWFADHGEKKDLAPLQLNPEAAELYDGIEELDRYYAPILINPFVIGYNTDSGEPITDPEQMLDLPADAKLGLLDPNIAPATAFWWKTVSEGVPGLLEAIGEHNPRLSMTGAPLAQGVAAGELDFMIPMVPGTIEPLQAEGAAIDQSVPEDYVTGVEYGAGITANSQHPNAAQVFVNWMMSRDGEAFILDKWGPGAIVSGDGDSLGWDDIAVFERSDVTQEDLDAFVAETFDPALGR